MRYIIVLTCQRRDQQRLGPVLHTSKTVHFPRLLTKDSLKKKHVGKGVGFSFAVPMLEGYGKLA